MNDRQCGDEIVNGTIELAKENNLVILFGASDDLMEFRGAIDDELDCFEGGTAYLTKFGLLQECECECVYYRNAKTDAKTIEALWCEDEYSWTYKTDLPHETFEIFEDDEKYCKGIIFSLNDIK